MALTVVADDPCHQPFPVDSGFFLRAADTPRLAEEPTAAVMPTDKPVWHFSVAVGLNEATVAVFGGLVDNALPYIREQFDTINSRFNVPDVFAGHIEFSVDTIFDFSGIPPLTVPASCDFAVHYFDIWTFSDSLRGSWGQFKGYQTNIVYLVWSDVDEGGPIGDWPTDILLHEMGHTRGAIDQYAMWVPAPSNPINGEEYPMDPTIMGSTELATVWDQHSVNLVNRASDSILSDLSHLHGYFPPVLAVRVVDLAGRPVPQATVRLFPVPLYQFLVVPTAVYTASCDDSGLCSIPADAYGPIAQTSGNPFEYTNLLAEAEFDGTFGYTWLPLDDVQNAWFADSLAPFVTDIALDLVTSVADGHFEASSDAISVYAGYPNPFNATTTFPIEVRRSTHVRADILNVAGQHVRTLSDGLLPVGDHVMVWDATDDWGAAVASGIYFMRLRAADQAVTAKVVLIQ
jgi:hypothetical protein